MILLALLLTSVTSPKECPSAQDLSPCACVESIFGDGLKVHCAGADLASVQQSMSSLRGKVMRELHFEKVKFGRMPAGFFKEISVQTLLFENCEMIDPLIGSDEPAFTGLEDSIRNLELKNSTQDPVKPPVLSHLRELVSFSIDYATIPHLDADWVAGMPASLRDFTVMNTGLESVASGALAGLQNLEVIVFAYQKIKSFSRDVLPRPANELKELTLSACELTGLPEDMFEEMPYLRYVAISQNQFRTFPSKTWSPAWSNLNFFMASDNPIQCDDESIEWMFRVRRPSAVDATCASPESMAFRNLGGVIDDHKQ